MGMTSEATDRPDDQQRSTGLHGLRAAPLLDRPCYSGVDGPVTPLDSDASCLAFSASALSPLPFIWLG
jgi:hypothetical protein